MNTTDYSKKKKNFWSKFCIFRQECQQKEVQKCVKRRKKSVVAITQALSTLTSPSWAKCSDNKQLSQVLDFPCHFRIFEKPDYIPILVHLMCNSMNLISSKGGWYILHNKKNKKCAHIYICNQKHFTQRKCLLENKLNRS